MFQILGIEANTKCSLTLNQIKKDQKTILNLLIFFACMMQFGVNNGGKLLGYV